MRPNRDHVMAMMEKFRLDMGVAVRRAGESAPPKKPPPVHPPSHGKVDERGITAEMRALLGKVEHPA
jgi:hypothetical protein